jgi:glycosyltransferase involved in cell wall biosynthesis
LLTRRDRVRILYSHRVHSRDGQSVHIEELVAAFRKAGHEIVVVGPALYHNASFGGESALVGLLRRIMPRPLVELAELFHNVPAFLKLRRAYRDLRPDFVYERYNLYHFAGLWLKSWYRAPFYLEINSPLAEERARFGGLGLPRLARWLERAIWRSADRVFVVSAVLGDIVAAAGVARERIVVMPNGVDRDAFPLQPYEARPDAAVTIGFVGFVRDWHGVDAVIAGLAANRSDPPARLIVAGDGPARPALERQAEALGIGDCVQFAGLTEREAIPQLLRIFDIAVQPQSVCYASPLKLFEYLACGRAIVAPDQPNIREILTDGETALLFDPDDPAAMWRAMRRLLADPALRERLGRAARTALDTRDYTWQGNVARITAMVGRDLARRAAPPHSSVEPGE